MRRCKAYINQVFFSLKKSEINLPSEAEVKFLVQEKQV